MILRTLLLTAALAWLCLGQNALGQAPAAEIVETRMAVQELLSWNMEPLALMAKGLQEFDPARAEAHAARIAMLAPLILETFAPDTRGTEVYNRAKDLIWQNPVTFTEHTRDLQRAALAMQEAAATGELAAVQGEIRNLGGACGACHDLFRFLESDPAFPFREQVQ